MYVKKTVIRVHFLKLRFIHNLKAEAFHCYGNIELRYNYLEICNLRVQKHQNIEKITFKIVQMKFLAMHITNKKWRFDIFTVGIY